ncbi:hypothetical protein M1D49_22370 [Bacillus sp. PK3-056]|uniref:hypothetical protein n=1 Tax=Niallia TaxID=2837506 RepID=UPI0002E44F70|nr:hypothetical protein [Niallia circulans]
METKWIPIVAAGRLSENVSEENLDKLLKNSSLFVSIEMKLNIVLLRNNKGDDKTETKI